MNAKALRVLRVLVVGACLAGCAGSRFRLPPPGELRYRVQVDETQWELPNGMSAVLLPDRSTQLIEVDMRYRVGSRDDPPGKEGLAHLVEHLMFTQRVGGSGRPSLGTRLRERALYVNAATTSDYTHYRALASDASFDELLEIEASRLVVGCATISQAVLDREREVIRNELRSKPEAELLGQLYGALYPPGHPYAHSPGGTDAGLAAVTLSDVCSFVKRNYVVSRAILVVAGNIDEPRMDAGLRRYFGPLRATGAEPQPSVPPVIAQPGTVTVEANVNRTLIFGAWPAPPEYGSEHAALDMALTTLVLGSRFLGGVERPFAVVGTSVENPADVEDVKRKLMSHIAAGGVWTTTLATARSARAVRFLGELESLGDRAEQFANWRQFEGAGSRLIPELQAWTAYDAAALRAAIAKSCDPASVRWVVFKPKAGQTAAFDAEPKRLRIDTVDELPVDVQDAERAAPIPATAAEAASPAASTLANGLGLTLMATSNGLPMVTVRLTFRTGYAHDPADKLGLATLTAHMLVADSAARNEGTFSLDHEVDVGADYTTFEMHSLAVHLDAMLATLGSLIEEGAYRELSHGTLAYEALTEPKRMRVLAIERELLGALFGADHPYANGGDVAPWTWKNIARFDLLDFKRRHYVGKNGALVITGAFDPDWARTLAARYLSGFPAGAPSESIPPTRPVRAGAIGIVKDAAPLTQVFMGWPAGPEADARYPARLVAARILNRRMAVVRESLGASYGVSAELLARSGGGVYLVEGEVDSKRAAEALRIIRAEAASLRAGERLEADFVRARQEAVRDLLGRATATTELAANIDWLSRSGRPSAYRDELIAAVAKLSVDDVRRVMAADLRLDHEAIALTGPHDFLEKTFAAAGVSGARYVDAK